VVSEKLGLVSLYLWGEIDHSELKPIINHHDEKMLSSGILVGTVLHDSYEITRLIEEGGMGMVFEARSVRLAKKRFAVKVLRGAVVSEDPEAYARFRQEADIISSLGHPNIVDVIDFNITEEDGSPYMVMELLTGEDLGSRLERQGRLHPEEAGLIFLQVGAALQAAHDEGIVHRDLKPKNIFLVNEPGNPNKVKLLDFGISKLRNSSRVLTKHHSAVGTPMYMSPEQTEGGEIDHTTDVFSMATTAYICLTGKHPFEGPTEYKIMQRVCQADPLPITELLPELPEAAQKVLKRAHAKSREARHESAEEFGVELAEALGIAWARTGRISGVHDMVEDSGPRPVLGATRPDSSGSGRRTRLETPPPSEVERLERETPPPQDVAPPKDEPPAIGPATPPPEVDEEIVPTALRPTPPPDKTMILHEGIDSLDLDADSVPAIKEEKQETPQQSLSQQSTKILDRDPPLEPEEPDPDKTPPPTMVVSLEEAVDPQDEEEEAPVETPVEAPVEAPMEAPVEAPVEARVEASVSPVPAPPPTQGSNTGKIDLAGSRKKPVVLAALVGGGAALALVLFFALGPGAATDTPQPAPAPSPDMQALAAPSPDQKIAPAVAPASPDASPVKEAVIPPQPPKPVVDRTPTRQTTPPPKPMAPKPAVAPRVDISGTLARAQKAFKTAQALNNPALYKKALKVAHRVLSVEPRHPQALHIAGASACQVGDDRQFKRARALLSKSKRAAMEASCPKKKEPPPKPAGPTAEQRQQANMLAASADKALKTGQMLSQPALLKKARGLGHKALKLDPANQRAMYVRAAASCLLGNRAAGQKEGARLSAKLKAKLQPLCSR